MTSRPGPGVHESLQPRAPGRPPRTHVHRRPSKPTNALVQPDCIDPALEEERPPINNGANELTRPPPRGRPHFFFTNTHSGSFELPVHSLPYQPTTNLPAPPRPGSVHSRDALQQRRMVPGGSGVKDPPRSTAPDVVAPPVYFSGGKAADLSPWTGNHAEDTLSEVLVKSGISNKPQIMNETSTARLSLWSNLKNKSGISTLSSLFVAVLEKRQQTGRLLTPNTFKPPPRLTLRDSTREQWLHDLANPTIGLRRLSRTIPHGLTGKVLLEQCLNKNIPLPRALWLAKCVGTNELRAHKRKGQAGTVTWGRTWTSSVEQFLESVIGAIAQGDWKPRITYALQLATLLYKEHLLDDDHFLDWIINGLDSCSSERLFIWLCVISISQYWDDMTCCRRRGKRLAETILNQLEKLYHLEDQASYSAVVHYLENTLIKMLAIRPACLLLPMAWRRYESTFKTLAGKRNHPQITAAVQKLEHRNSRLMVFPRNPSSMSMTPAGRIFRLLDAVDYNHALRIDELSNQCMDVILDGTQLIAILLQWACSHYRQGLHRIYLATRLLRRWNQLGADVYEGVISYLQDTTWVDTGDSSMIFKIIAELVRSKTFAAGRALQWLIATGFLTSDLDSTLSSSWPLRLITEIPLNGLSNQTRALRSTLLRGTAHSAVLEEQNLDIAKSTISQALPVLCNVSKPITALSNGELDQVSPTIKLELGIWLRQQVAQHTELNQHVPTKDSAVEETATVSLMTSHDFHIVRSYLERFGDLAILADVVGIATSSLDSAVLVSAADTINYHMMAFRAIGAFDPLFGKIATRYAAVRTVRFAERELLLSLSHLAQRARDDCQLQQLLAYDIGRLDQKNTLAACSPASDNTGEVLLTGASSDEEIERILASGTSMDEHMMARVLRKIVSNLKDHVAKRAALFDHFHAWLYRLRSFDDATFEAVLSEWLTSCLMAGYTEDIQAAIPIMIGSGCFKTISFLETYRTCLAKLRYTSSEQSFLHMLQALWLILPSETLHANCSPQDAYCYRMEQHKLAQEKADQIIQILYEIVDASGVLSSQSIHDKLLQLLLTKAVLSLARRCITLDPHCLARLGQGNAGLFFKPVLDTLLDPDSHLQISKLDPEQQVLAVFSVASELSLPVCQVVIEHIFVSNTALTGGSGEALSAALLQAIKTAVEKGQSAGLQLLASLDSGLTNKIRQHAEGEIISASHFLTAQPPTGTDVAEQTTAAIIENYLSVIDLTLGQDGKIAEHPTLLVALVERFRGISQLFSEQTLEKMQNSRAEQAAVLNTYTWLTAMLRLTAINCSTMLRQATHNHQVALMAALISLIVHPCFEWYPSISEHVFDITVQLSEYISDDARNHLARLDSIRLAHDMRCYFILGVPAPVDGWLALSKPMSIPSALSSPQLPTPGIGLNQPLSPQSAQLSPAGPPTPQRYLNPAFPAQQARAAPQNSQQQQPHIPHNKMLPAQLQRTSTSTQLPPSSLQQMQQMQQLQGLAQQRASQPSPVYSQRSTFAASSSSVSSGTPPFKLQIGQERETKLFPFVQPRWEILAESSGNPSANETAVNLMLFGARKV